ncbi:glycosyltransferase family 4 protein [Aquiflexum sp. LQ15W]|uniref:glycosyltransferase family 4 protein n=1 Tax=Cognataquiflexum nitidum TaxID=2922272 RepID=UPI001F134B31|nr:glycosyltransferase family 4 protein [Cognataquiflexum nitidum]MCH6201893.1 glycosyltransferase family 4 protein [Cognataquiflexum nitidum]
MNIKSAFSFFKRKSFCSIIKKHIAPKPLSISFRRYIYVGKQIKYFHFVLSYCTFAEYYKGDFLKHFQIGKLWILYSLFCKTIIIDLFNKLYSLLIMSKIFFTQESNIELMVQGGKPMGGAVVATQVWMESLNELGNEVMLFRNIEDNRQILEKYKWVNSVKVYNSKKGFPILRWPFYRLPKFFVAIKKSRPDFVLESIPTWTSYFYCLICHFLGTKHILRLANDNMLDERIKWTHSTFERFFIARAFKKTDFILTQNQFQFNNVKAKYPSKKVIKISNPFRISKQELNFKTLNKGYISWVANFRYQKNLQLLYRIAVQLPNEQFKIAGQPLIPMDQESTEYLEKLKSLSNVHLVGSISRDMILDFLKDSKFLLNTSRYEGFSNTFLEAMQSGTPILTTPNVNPDSIISDYQIGMIYEDEANLRLILENMTEEIYLNMSKNCIDYIENNHDHLVLGKKLLDFLHDTQ